jgi:hypothetical protein
MTLRSRPVLQRSGQASDAARHRCRETHSRAHTAHDSEATVGRREPRNGTLHLVDGSLLSGTNAAAHACLLLAGIAAAIPDIALADSDHVAVTGLDVLLLEEGFGDPLTGGLLVDGSSGIALTIEACPTIYSRIVIVSSGQSLESTAMELTACGARTIIVALVTPPDAVPGAPLSIRNGGATLS